MGCQRIVEVLTDIPVALDVAALMDRAHVPADSDDARAFGRLIEKAQEIARPKALYKEAYVQGRGADSVVIDGVTFVSRALRRNLDKVERVFPYVATCGRELEELAAAAADILEGFWVDVMKAELLRVSVARLGERIDSRHGLAKTATMNPGSGDATVWPIEQQGELFSLLGDVEGLIGVELTDSFLMVPNKSVSGIRFPTEIDFRTCQLCHREKCPSRAAPFDPELWQSIQRD